MRPLAFEHRDTHILNRLLRFAQARPQAALLWLLAVHVVVWTVVPILTSANLQLDLAETLALGREWQLGYWKHPPLPWWLGDLAYRLTGTTLVVYLLGPLSVAATFYVIYKFACEIVSPQRALIAVLALEGLHFFNFSAVKFNHDVLQLPFWALAAWWFHRGIRDERLLDWLLAGIALALAFWAKYAAFALGATFALVLLLDPVARRAWRTPGPYLMAAVFLVVLSPHLVWLVQHDLMPFRYVEERATVASSLGQMLLFPLRWTLGQIGFLVPLLVLLALALRAPRDAAAAQPSAFAQRYVMALAFGPFLVTTLLAALAGRLPVAMWGYPLWTFLPLAAVVWWPRQLSAVSLRPFAAAFLVWMMALPLAYAGAELLEPLVRDRPKATQFPGRQLAETLTAQWRARFNTPLAYVGGAKEVGTGPGEFPANNVAVYSPDRPHVLVHGDIALSPWIDPADIAARGAVLVWQGGKEGEIPAGLKAAFPHAELQPPLTLPRQGPFVRAPVVIHSAVVPPQP